jgi:multiple sugar transport system permease protein
MLSPELLVAQMSRVYNHRIGKFSIQTGSMKSDRRAAIIFLLPSLLGFAVFYAVPFVGGFIYSLLDRPVRGRFVGLANYAALVVNPIFLRAVVNTLLFSAMSLPLIMAVSLGVALLLNRAVRALTVFRAALIVPLAVPVASVVLVWQVLFDQAGPVNGLLGRIGITGPDWMHSGGALWVVLAVYLWKNVGYDMVLFLAGLQGIPPSYYEAARLDGAGRWRMFRQITLVYLTPTSFFVFVISLINSFKVFRETYLMAGAYPDASIYFMQHYMNNTFSSLNYQKLTSAAILMSLGIYALVLVLFGVDRRLRRVVG